MFLLYDDIQIYIVDPAQVQFFKISQTIKYNLVYMSDYKDYQ